MREDIGLCVLAAGAWYILELVMLWWRDTGWSLPKPYRFEDYE